MADYTLCWDCANSVSKGCEWARKLKPVKGWTADETKQGYLVRDCPEFIRDSYEQGQYRTIEEYIEAKNKKRR